MQVNARILAVAIFLIRQIQKKLFNQEIGQFVSSGSDCVSNRNCEAGFSATLCVCNE